MGKTNDTQSPPVTFKQDFIAGTVGGCIGLFVAHPVDVIKVRMQASGSKYTSVWSTAKLTLGKEGIGGVYKGIWPPFVTAGALNAVVFSVYGGVRRWLGQGQPIDEATSITVAAGIGGLATCVFSTPTELIKVQQQVDAKSKPTALTVAKRIVSTQGYKGLYRGWWVTVFRDTPSFSIYFLTYEGVKDRILESAQVTPVEPLYEKCAILTAGSVAGVTAWGMIYPIDTVKTIIQTEHVDPNKARIGWVTVGQQLYAKHGWTFFFRGFNAMVIRTIPMNAITFLMYEETLRFCHEVDIT